MKTFRQLSITDKIYYCKRHDIDFKEGIIKSINQNKLECAFGGGDSYNLTIEGDCLDAKSVVSRHNHHRSYDVIAFTVKSDAIRFCKTNLLRELRSKIEYAKKAIQEVIKFRLENIDHLNKDWIESEILKLEKIEREIL